MEHKPFVGTDYQVGVSGKKIAIVGWSHHLGNDDIDHEYGTINCINNVISEIWKIRFFNAIVDYFGSTHAKFWQNAIFFNFLPQVVGPSSNRYGNGTEEQLARGRERFLEILIQNQPEKVFIFTSRSQEFPEPDRNKFLPIRSEFEKFYVAYYKNCGFNGEVYFLRHPQGAQNGAMRNIVKYCMEKSRVSAEDLP